MWAVCSLFFFNCIYDCTQSKSDYHIDVSHLTSINIHLKTNFSVKIFLPYLHFSTTATGGAWVDNVHHKFDSTTVSFLLRSFLVLFPTKIDSFTAILLYSFFTARQRRNASLFQTLSRQLILFDS